MSAIYAHLEDLLKQPYALPTVIATVSIAVLITYILDKKEKRLPKNSQSENNHQTKTETSESSDSKPKAFALPSTPVPPPNWSRIFSPEDLAQHDGTDEDKPIFVAIKRTVFDVTTKKAMYGPSGGYHCFAGKDSSKALGMSSLKIEDCIADYSNLDEKERKTLDDWYAFFEKRYAIVGKTADDA